MNPPNRTYQFRSALIGENWRDKVAISVSNEGIITSIEDAGASVDRVLNYVAIPGIANVHSHAFQRAFAGLSEFRTATRDSFWTWRNLMFQFAAQLTPESVFVIARQVYLEMISAGYSWVGEFHYLHHTAASAATAEMAEAIIEAANASGIGLCLLPVLYQRGGFKDEMLAGGQNQFALTEEEIVSLFLDLDQRFQTNSDQKVGFAIHSLRAVAQPVADRVLNELKRARIGSEENRFPIHIHISEQMQEVEDCLSINGSRPVDYLMDHFDVDDDWCLIHATHMSESELNRVAQSGATVGLCPTTEANLGDGYFSAERFLAAKGSIGIGSDSHCSVDLSDELRTLEYGARLQRQSRAVLGTSNRSVGRRLIQASIEGGAKSLGLAAGKIQVGARADFTLIDDQHPAIAAAQGDRLLDRLVFTHTGNPIAGVVVGGNVIEINGEEFKAKREDSRRAFVDVCRNLQRG